MILFLDDEERRLSSHVMELRISGYQVNFFKDVSEALTFFEKHVDAIKLLILDIMMPPSGSFQSEDTEAGLRTGVRFLKKSGCWPRIPPFSFSAMLPIPLCGKS